MVLEENGEDKIARKITNDEMIERIVENKMLLYNILYIKVNWLDIS